MVDRREDESAFALGANRAAVEAERSAHNIPVQVEVETVEKTKTDTSGVTCVVETPGPAALLEELLGRVWNAR